MGTLSANFGASDAYTITLTWSEQSRDTAKNQTVLAFACTICSNRASATFTGQARTDALTVGDRTFTHYHGGYTVPGGGSVLLWSDTVTVTHDDDGSYENKAVGFSVMIDTTFSSTGWIGAVEAAGTMSLPAIPRASVLSFGAFTAGTAGKIAVEAAGSSFTHTIAMTFGDAAETLGAGVKNSLNWTPSLDLLAQIPNATSGTGTLTCETYLSGTLVGTTQKPFTLYVPDTVRPVITAFAASLVNDNAVVSGWGLALRTLTKLGWTAEAAGRYGSTVKSVVFSAGGVTGNGLSGTTAALPAAGTVTPTLTVTDSRGRTASRTLDPVEVHDYAAPTLGTAAARRCTEDGTPSAQGVCCLLNLRAGCSPVGGRNSVSLRYRLRPVSGSFSGWAALIDGQIVTGFALDTSYVVELSAVDAVGSSRAVQLTVPAASAALHLRDGGLGAAFGKYAEEDGLLDVAWGLRVRKAVTLDEPLSMASGGSGIVEEGTSGIWRYRKYENGMAECWGQQTFTGETTSAWGSLYALVCSLPNYPVAFTEPPVTVRDIRQNTNNSCWLSSWNVGSAVNAGQFALVRPNSAALNVTVSCCAFGPI